MKSLNLKIYLVLLSVVALSGCFESSDSPSPAAPAPVVGNVDAVMSAAGCTVTQLSSGVQFDCNGTTAILSNGTNGSVGATGSTGAQGVAGTNGTDGTNGTNGAGSLTTYDASSVAHPELRLMSVSHNSYALWSTDASAMVGYTGGKISALEMVYYESTGCSGRQYIQHSQLTTLISAPAIISHGSSVHQAPTFISHTCKRMDSTTSATVAYQSYKISNADAGGYMCYDYAGSEYIREVTDCSFPTTVPMTLSLPLYFQ